MVLLLGYLYAHWLDRALAPRRQAIVHISLLAASLISLPILPNPDWKTAAGHPAARILALLAVTVGLPYFTLSSTSPLLQAWYARSHKEGLPYRFFALSNAASMLALLSYPLLIEPNIATRTQGWIWSGAYIGFAVVCAITAWGANREPAYGAAAVAGSTVYEPCEQGGMAAISTAGDKIHVLWRGPASAWGSPVVGGGAVWVTDWTAGTLYELDPATGATRYSLSLGTSLPHFASLSMTGSEAYLGTSQGVVAVAGA